MLLSQIQMTFKYNEMSCYHVQCAYTFKSLIIQQLYLKMQACIYMYKGIIWYNCLPSERYVDTMITAGFGLPQTFVCLLYAVDLRFPFTVAQACSSMTVLQ